MAADSEEVLRELMAREPIFHRPEFGRTRADFERMTAPEFREVGASGREYERAYVLDELDRRHRAREAEPMLEAREFQCQWLAGEVYLLTYTLVQGGTRRTRRSTIWERRDGEWTIVFHQGTLMEEAGGSAGGTPRLGR